MRKSATSRKSPQQARVSGLLRLLCLGVDFGPLAEQEGHHLLVTLPARLHQRGVPLVIHLHTYTHDILHFYLTLRFICLNFFIAAFSVASMHTRY